jgi:hypothetical protein
MREKALDSLCHDVCRRMAEDVQLLLGGAFGNRAVRVNDFHSGSPLYLHNF